MSKYYFPKGRMVINTKKQVGFIVWFKNGRGRGRYIKTGQGVVDTSECAQKTYHDFDERNQFGQ